MSFYTQRKDGANTSSKWSAHRNCFRYNKLENYGSLTQRVINFFDIINGVLQGNTLAHIYL